jgi:hypothetical protein
MMKPQIPQGPYFSPCFQLQRFVGLQQKHGKKALIDRKFQAERESWVAAVFLLGYSQLTQQDWWLMPADDDPPDIIAVTLDEGDRGLIARRLDIEVFEYEQNSLMNDLVGTIQRKLTGKNYPDDYQIICYVHDHEGETFVPGKVAEQLRNLNLHDRHIWVVASLQSNIPTEYVLVRLVPEPLVHCFDYVAACEGNRLPDSIDLKRGPTKTPTKFGWRIMELP